MASSQSEAWDWDLCPISRIESSLKGEKMLARVQYNYAISVGHGRVQKNLECRKLNIIGQDRCAKKATESIKEQ